MASKGGDNNGRTYQAQVSTGSHSEKINVLLTNVIIF